MKLMKSILVAINFDGSLDPVIQRTVSISKKYDAELSLINVINYAPYNQYSMIGWDHLYNQALKKLKLVESRLTEKGIKVKNSFVKLGNVYKTIIETAKQENVNLIIAGAGNKSSPDSMVLGSIAEKLIKESGCPVMVVHPMDHTDKIEEVICAIDFSTSSHRLIDNGIHLAKSMGASLTILYAIEFPVKMSDIYNSIQYHLERDHVKKANEKANELIIDDKINDIKGFLESFDCTNLELKIMVKVSRASDLIIDYCKNSHDALLLIGAVGHSGWFHDLVVGSTTDKILRKVSTSVLTIHDKDLFEVQHDFGPYKANLEANIDELITIDLGIVPESIKESYQAGLDLKKDGFLEDAILEFQHCTDMYPNLYQAYAHMRDCCERLNDPDRAAYFQSFLLQHEQYVKRQIERHRRESAINMN